MCQFDLSHHIDAAGQDVQADAAVSTLRKNLPHGPAYTKVSPSNAPTIALVLTTGTISVNDTARTLIGQRFSRVSGLLSIEGGIKPAEYIQTDLISEVDKYRPVVVAHTNGTPTPHADRLSGDGAGRGRGGESRRHRAIASAARGLGGAVHVAGSRVGP